ncbi:MAG TPA: hypothetical protein PLF84_06200 [Bryobacteraceae bacterium]|nr:hypothetical protein [Bryobacteraceae bacterium]
MVDPLTPLDELAMASNDVLRGRTFYFSHFDIAKFFNSERCSMCGQMIGHPDTPEVLTCGYVTPMSVEYVGLPTSYFWSWVCTSCFEQYGKAMNWSKTEGIPPDLPREEVRAFRRAWNERARQQRKRDSNWHEQYPFAQTGWSVQDAVGIARLHGFEISDELGRQLLEEHEGAILSAMDGAAVRAILGLLRREYAVEIEARIEAEADGKGAV